jgi:hypothetical protein
MLISGSDSRGVTLLMAEAGRPKSDRPRGPSPAAPVTDPARAGEDRRRHPRVAAVLPFRIVNEAGQEEPFRLLDLSESGARIQCGHAVPPMTRIQVRLVLPGRRVGLDRDVRVDTAGVIVWSHRTGDQAYDTGVFFPDLEEEQRGLLRTLVRAAR